MRQIDLSGRFKRDLKRMKKRGAKLRKFGEIVDLLVADLPLPARCRQHKLVGDYKGLWECHIEPDWLLVYDLPEGLVTLVATGTHSDLFRK